MSEPQRCEPKLPRGDGGHSPKPPWGFLAAKVSRASEVQTNSDDHKSRHTVDDAHFLTGEKCGFQKNLSSCCRKQTFHQTHEQLVTPFLFAFLPKNVIKQLRLTLEGQRIADRRHTPMACTLGGVGPLQDFFTCFLSGMQTPP